jgi:ABC-type transporter Mla maintaining outer membrane lipid asymmetry ATPase subunit MlaF
VAAGVTEPLIALSGIEKAYGADAPLRVASLSLAAGERIALVGLPAAAAEILTNLVTGASLPEQGTVTVFGRRTSEIDTDTAWLHSLDRFGLVSARAVLLDQSTVAQNLALPLTLSIDPMPDDVRSTVDALAREAGLTPETLAAAPPAGGTAAADAVRARVHLARAIALQPSVLIVEAHGLDDTGFARDLGAVLARRGLAALVTTGDPAFARAAGCRVLRLTDDGRARAGGALSRWRWW